MAVPYLEGVVGGKTIGHTARCRGEEGGQVYGVSVAEAGIVEGRSIVVHSHGAIGDLVASVAIDICHSQVMVPLSGIASLVGVVGVEDPAEAELLAVEIVGGEHGACVVASAEDGTQVLTVEVATGGQEAVAAVGVVITPGANLASLRNVIHGGQGTSRAAIEAGNPFGSFVDEAASARFGVHVIGPTGTAELLVGVVVGLINLMVRPTDVVCFRVAEDVAQSVDGAIGGSHEEFSTAVAIEVGDDEGCVVSSAADIRSEVYAPERGAVESQGLEDGGGGDAALAVVARVGGIPFEDDFQLAVAVEVGHGGVVGVVGD